VMSQRTDNWGELAFGRGYHACSPRLVGLPSHEEIRQCSDGGYPYSIWLNVGPACDLHCPRCFNDNPGTGCAGSDDLSVLEIQRILAEAATLGVQSIVVPGFGEPFHPNNQPATWTILEGVGTLGMRAVVFTHGGHIEPSMVERLGALPVSLFVKYDSPRATIQDLEAGQDGYTQRRERALQLLIGAGFAASPRRNETRLGLVTTMMPSNISDIPWIHRSCRELGLFPDYDTVLPVGRGREPRSQVDPASALRLLQQLRTIDAEYGMNWDAAPTDVSFSCARPLYNLHVSPNGSVSPCVGTTHIDLGSLRDAPLARIWSSQPAVMVRQYVQRLDGACVGCENLSRGCRPCLSRCLTEEGRERLIREESVGTLGCWMRCTKE